MANSTLTAQLTEIVSSQAQKEITANANFRAASPSMSFARNDITTSGLSWAYYGGTILVDNISTQIAAGTITSIPPNIAANIHLEIGRVSATTTNITGFSIAAAAQITVATNSFAIGDVGYLSTGIASPTNAQGTFFKVTTISGSGPYTLTTDIVSTGWNAWTSGGTIAKVTPWEGTAIVGKTHAFHFPVCMPLYTLTTDASNVTTWTDYRGAFPIVFNVNHAIAGYNTLRVNGVDQLAKLAIARQTTGPSLLTYNANSVSADSGAAYYNFRARGTLSLPTIVLDGDTLSADFAGGYDGIDYALGGSAKFIVDGTPGADDMPTRYEVAISNDGSQTPTTRFTLKSTGPIFNSDNINIATEKTPASATATGTKGQICWDASYIYVCIATDVWKRAAIVTWP